MAVESSDLKEMIRLASLPLIAARVRRARKDSGLSHDEIGRRMGAIAPSLERAILRQTLIKWEGTKHRPDEDLLRRYAEATGRPVEWFLDPDLDPSPFQEDEAA